ncbi:nitrogen fixation protein FixH [Rhizobium pisi]|uniref:Nitrogen fixation protein FixH n=2 Tax=Rhizobium TaxID=379 RepID=A0A7W6B9C6_9HYPH|nr:MULTISPECIES: hypothetical protein [Rhizobium]MBB3135739.1 nitrogen fixation protein FixH [Rhizobium pisi]MBB3915014.1 nitrogen fixation protein FixH [Rhizobium fabae]RSB76208.1 hypothetical protein EFD55_17460 [Rhizobium pisi]RUM12472.1 hypothetical protein EFB14_14300 [Rhizobium fabae]TCA59042.1 hypothetical protein E0J16_11830 [Rhizobium pisi]
MNRNIIRLLAAATLLSLAGAAHASSDAAWQQFAADVEAKCKKAAVTIEKPTATIDPFGSTHYGLALLTGKPKGAKGLIAQICVYDKQKKTVEIGSELDGKKLGLMPAK